MYCTCGPVLRLAYSVSGRELGRKDDELEVFIWRISSLFYSKLGTWSSDLVPSPGVFFFFHWLNLIVNSYCFVLQDFQDAYDLLQTNNVNHEKLLSYAREAANFSTNNQLPKLDFALNHYHKEDVAMFDFTSLYHSEHAAKMYERRGRRLLALVVGDSLLEVCIQKTQNVRCNDIISLLYLL